MVFRGLVGNQVTVPIDNYLVCGICQPFMRGKGTGGREATSAMRPLPRLGYSMAVIRHLERHQVNVHFIVSRRVQVRQSLRELMALSSSWTTSGWPVNAAHMAGMSIRICNGSGAMPRLAGLLQLHQRSRYQRAL